MRSLVVLLAVVVVARGSLVGLVAQPPHHPAVVLDPHGRPLETAEVIGARAIHLQAKALDSHHGYLVAPITHSVDAPVAHSVIAPVAAVSHQSRVDVHSSPAVIATHAAPIWDASLLGHGLHGHGHWLKKRSLFAHAPIVAAPAVSHQTRVDLISSPVVPHAIAAPYVAHATPVVKYVGGSAVSHQSRVDVHANPAVVSHSVVAPVVSHSVYAAPYAHASAVYAHSGYLHSSPALVAW